MPRIDLTEDELRTVCSAVNYYKNRVYSPSQKDKIEIALYKIQKAYDFILSCRLFPKQQETVK